MRFIQLEKILYADLVQSIFTPSQQHCFSFTTITGKRTMPSPFVNRRQLRELIKNAEMIPLQRYKRIREDATAVIALPNNNNNNNNYNNGSNNNAANRNNTYDMVENTSKKRITISRANQSLRQSEHSILNKFVTDNDDSNKEVTNDQYNTTPHEHSLATVVCQSIFFDPYHPYTSLFLQTLVRSIRVHCGSTMTLVLPHSSYRHCHNNINSNITNNKNNSSNNKAINENRSTSVTQVEINANTIADSFLNACYKQLTRQRVKSLQSLLVLSLEEAQELRRVWSHYLPSFPQRWPLLGGKSKQSNSHKVTNINNNNNNNSSSHHLRTSSNNVAQNVNVDRSAYLQSSESEHEIFEEEKENEHHHHHRHHHRSSQRNSRHSNNSVTTATPHKKIITSTTTTSKEQNKIDSNSLNAHDDESGCTVQVTNATAIITKHKSNATHDTKTTSPKSYSENDRAQVNNAQLDARDIELIEQSILPFEKGDSLPPNPFSSNSQEQQQQQQQYYEEFRYPNSSRSSFTSSSSLLLRSSNNNNNSTTTTTTTTNLHNSSKSKNSHLPTPHDSKRRGSISALSQSSGFSASEGVTFLLTALVQLDDLILHRYVEMMQSMFCHTSMKNEFVQENGEELHLHHNSNTTTTTNNTNNTNNNNNYNNKYNSNSNESRMKTNQEVNMQQHCPISVPRMLCECARTMGFLEQRMICTLLRQRWVPLVYTLCSIAAARGASTRQQLLLVRALRSLRVLLSTLSPFHNTVRLSVFLRTMPHDVMIAFLQQAALVHGGLVSVLPILTPSSTPPITPPKEKGRKNNNSNNKKMMMKAITASTNLPQVSSSSSAVAAVALVQNNNNNRRGTRVNDKRGVVSDRNHNNFRNEANVERTASNPLENNITHYKHPKLYEEQQQQQQELQLQKYNSNNQSSAIDLQALNALEVTLSILEQVVNEDKLRESREELHIFASWLEKCRQVSHPLSLHHVVVEIDKVVGVIAAKRAAFQARENLSHRPEREVNYLTNNNNNNDYDANTDSSEIGNNDEDDEYEEDEDDYYECEDDYLSDSSNNDPNDYNVNNGINKSASKLFRRAIRGGLGHSKAEDYLYQFLAVATTYLRLTSELFMEASFTNGSNSSNNNNINRNNNNNNRNNQEMHTSTSAQWQTSAVAISNITTTTLPPLSTLPRWCSREIRIPLLPQHYVLGCLSTCAIARYNVSTNKNAAMMALTAFITNTSNISNNNKFSSSSSYSSMTNRDKINYGANNLMLSGNGVGSNMGRSGVNNNSISPHLSQLNTLNSIPYAPGILMNSNALAAAAGANNNNISSSNNNYNNRNANAPRLPNINNSLYPSYNNNINDMVAWREEDEIHSPFLPELATTPHNTNSYERQSPLEPMLQFNTSASMNASITALNNNNNSNSINNKMPHRMLNPASSTTISFLIPRTFVDQVLHECITHLIDEEFALLTLPHTQHKNNFAASNYGGNNNNNSNTSPFDKKRAIVHKTEERNQMINNVIMNNPIKNTTTRITNDKYHKLPKMQQTLPFSSQKQSPLPLSSKLNKNHTAALTRVPVLRNTPLPHRASLDNSPLQHSNAQIRETTHHPISDQTSPEFDCRQITLQEES